jgi:hypothetical protein
MRLADAYAEIVRGRARPEAQAWLDDALSDLDAGFDAPQFGIVFAAAGRRLGAEPVTLDAAETKRFTAAGLPAPGGWALDEIGRTALLRAALVQLPESAHRAFVDELFRRGDNRERQAVLRALAVLPGPERFESIAVEACRTNVRPVFEAIACQNPYAGRHFTDHHFAHLVLKALFTGVPLATVAGLDTRRTPDLVRMVDDYARERRAAGRPVPPDCALVLGKDRMP